MRKLITFHLLVKKLTLHQPVNDLGNKVKNTPIDYLNIAFERSEKQWMFHQSNGFKYTLPQIVWCGAGFWSGMSWPSLWRKELIVSWYVGLKNIQISNLHACFFLTRLFWPAPFRLIDTSLPGKIPILLNLLRNPVSDVFVWYSYKCEDCKRLRAPAFILHWENGWPGQG